MRAAHREVREGVAAAVEMIGEGEVNGAEGRPLPQGGKVQVRRQGEVQLGARVRLQHRAQLAAVVVPGHIPEQLGAVDLQRAAGAAGAHQRRA